MRSRSKSVLVALVVVSALSGLSAASALASGPPSVETKPATTINGSQAKLNGVLSGARTYYFEYGPTTAYGSKTREFLTSEEKKEVGKVVEGLSVSTKYHFRLVAKNGGEKADGADETFTTTIGEKPYLAAAPKGKLNFITFQGSTGTAGWATEGDQWNCGGMEVLNGQARNPKTVTVGKLRYTGCKYNVGLNRHECTSKGAAKEEILTSELQGTLVWISKATKKVGLLFRPAAGELLTEFSCTGTEHPQPLRGTVLLTIESSNNELHKEIHLGRLEANQEYENERGEKLHAELETRWPNGPAYHPLIWSWEAMWLKMSEEIEIQA